MKLQIESEVAEDQFRPKKCTVGLSDIDFAEDYGWYTELIGYLKPLAIETNQTYVFYLEKIVRDGKVGTVHVLDLNNEEDRVLIMQALINDYMLNQDQIKFL